MDSNPKNIPRHQPCFRLAPPPGPGALLRLVPSYQVRTIPMASPSRALRRLGVRGRAFKNAALPFKPFQDLSFDFGAVVNEELVGPEVPEVFPRHSQGIVRMPPSFPGPIPSPILRSSRCPFSCRGPALHGFPLAFIMWPHSQKASSPSTAPDCPVVSVRAPFPYHLRLEEDFFFPFFFLNGHQHFFFLFTPWICKPIV